MSSRHVLRLSQLAELTAHKARIALDLMDGIERLTGILAGLLCEMPQIQPGDRLAQRLADLSGGMLAISSEVRHIPEANN
jgi:hypothetical protein